MERTWIIEADDYGRLPADELAQLGADVATMVARSGGVAGITCNRRYRGTLPGTNQQIFDSLAVVVTYNSFAPGERPRTPEAAAQEVLPPEPEPAAEEPSDEDPEAITLAAGAAEARVEA